MTYSVIGCPECDHHWIVTDLRQQQTATCPRCEHTRKEDKIKALAQSDDRQKAAEDRARLLAKRAGYFDDFVNSNDEYWVMERRIQEQLPAIHETQNEHIEERLGIYHDKYADLADAYLEQSRIKRRNILADEAAAYLERRFGRRDETSASSSDSSDCDRLPACEVDGSGSITPTSQQPLDLDVSVDLDGRPITSISREFVVNLGTQQLLAEGLQDADADADAIDETLAAAGVDALSTSVPGGSKTSAVRELARRAAAGDEGALDQLFGLLPELGTRTSIGIQSTTQDIFTSYPRLFAALDVTPTVVVTVQQAFFEDLQTSQQRDLARWLAELSHGCDVTVVGGRVTLRELFERHHKLLPTEFSDQLKARRDNDGAIDEQVATARDELDPDGDTVAVLRRLDAEASDTLEFGQLVEEATVSRSRVSQRLGTLEDLNLIDRYGTHGNRRVELTPVGQELLATLDADIGRQADFESLFSDVSSSSDEGVSFTRTWGDQDQDRDTAQPSNRNSPPHRLDDILRAVNGEG